MALFLAMFALQADANETLKLGAYALPPREILSYFEQPRHLNTSLSNLNAARTHFARVQSNGQTRLSDISNPYENFAGIMVDPKANRSRTLSFRTATKIVLTDAKDFSQKTIEAPANHWLSSASWSPDGKMLMYLLHDENGSRVMLYDPKSNSSKTLTNRRLLATSVTPEWTGDSQSVVAVFVPENRPAEPKYGQVPSMPRVQVADPAKNKLRVYRSLLLNKTDEDRFEYFMTGQLAKVSLNGNLTQVGKPAMYLSIDTAPKGDYFRVTMMQRPFSYIVPASNFGRKEEVIDLAGKPLAVLSDVKLRTGGDADTPAPTTGNAPAAAPAQPARRQLAWHPNGNGFLFVRTKPRANAQPAPAAPEFPKLTAQEWQETGWEDAEWAAELQQRRGGAQGAQGANAPAAPREPEELVHWTAPFRKEDEKVLLTRDNGFTGMATNEDGSAIFLNETSSGVTNFKRITLATGKEDIWWSVKPREEAPGTIVQRANSLGVSVIPEMDGTLLLRSTTAARGNNEEESSELQQSQGRGPARASLNRFDLSTKKVEKVWEAESSGVQSIEAILDPFGKSLVVNHQSATEVPNSYLVTDGKRGKALTANIDHAPDLTAAKKYRFQVTRVDGFKFWVNVTAPKWHVEGMKLPAFFWFYPREVESQEAYNRGVRPPSTNTFPNLGGNPKALLLRRGWALVEPDIPIVGPAGRINDFYVNDLRNGLSAVIDGLEEKGIADRTKLAIGGHSYGGFSTANAMVHTPFFKAGIAGAGNYNRTLTPLAFQSETRTLWEARSIYLDMSPILYAENLNGAMLMYAGMDDQNVGTDPTNSIRMYHVLESIGKTTALYMYPYEDHGQIARETQLDQWARWIAWLEKYVTGTTK